ncbi:hypothetical protein EniLVp02_0179 [Vibrio phage EniLVp02]
MSNFHRIVSAAQNNGYEISGESCPNWVEIEFIGKCSIQGDDVIVHRPNGFEPEIWSVNELIMFIEA